MLNYGFYKPHYARVIQVEISNSLTIYIFQIRILLLFK